MFMKNYWVISEYGDVVLILFTFMVDLIKNLISGIRAINKPNSL